MRRFSFALLVCLFASACVDPGPDHPAARGQLGTPDDESDAATDAETDAGPAEDAGMQPEPGDGMAQFIVLNDTTTGVGVGATFGSDLDAATWTCPDGRSGAGVAVTGLQRGSAVEFPLEGAVGAPDGPCEPLSECAAHSGPGGWLAVEVRSGDLSGCTVALHELADGGEDEFELWLCPVAALDTRCVGPLAAGQDGEVVMGEVP
jgi:hypothetical protein